MGSQFIGAFNYSHRANCTVGIRDAEAMRIKREKLRTRKRHTQTKFRSLSKNVRHSKEHHNTLSKITRHSQRHHIILKIKHLLTHHIVFSKLQSKVVRYPQIKVLSKLTKSIIQLEHVLQHLINEPSFWKTTHTKH